jgi:UDP-4-amino-4-deoxy-L-arabinose-oxoglutarate aminotransferase
VRLDIEACGISRNNFMQALKNMNIGSGLHFRAVHLQKFYRETCRQPQLPNTEWNSKRIMSLPLFPGMRPEDIADVVQAIRTILRSGADHE